MSPAEREEKGSIQDPEGGPTRLELYFFPECPYCRKVLAAIDDLGLQDRVVYRNVRADPGENAGLLELTGKSQVPCLVIDGRPMHESEDIKRYLYRTFPG